MTKKEKQRRIAHEVLIILGMLALLTFICRLWPILLLLILGIFIAAIRLLFLSSRKVEVVEIAPIPNEPQKEPTEKDVRALAYSVILRRISELVTDAYPEARWVWENPNAMQQIEDGGELYILLNRAGGYRRARVVIKNLQVLGLSYQAVPAEEKPVPDPVEPEPVPDKDDSEEDPEQENYELLAFEWVEAHIMELNERCNEAIGQGRTELVLTVDELPIRDSWPDICTELKRAELSDVTCITEGIRINLTQ